MTRRKAVQYRSKAPEREVHERLPGDNPLPGPDVADNAHKGPEGPGLNLRGGGAGGRCGRWPCLKAASRCGFAKAPQHSLHQVCNCLTPRVDID